MHLFSNHKNLVSLLCVVLMVASHFTPLYAHQPLKADRTDSHSPHSTQQVSADESEGDGGEKKPNQTITFFVSVGATTFLIGTIIIWTCILERVFNAKRFGMLTPHHNRLSHEVLELENV